MWSIRKTSFECVMLNNSNKINITFDLLAGVNKKFDCTRYNKQLVISRPSTELCSSLPSDLQHTLTLASERRTSSWLSALPIEEHGFALHKSAFRDALCLWYRWLPSGLPAQCACGQGFTADHVTNCPTGGFPALRHNEL